MPSYCRKSVDRRIQDVRAASAMGMYVYQAGYRVFKNPLSGTEDAVGQDLFNEVILDDDLTISIGGLCVH